MLTLSNVVLYVVVPLLAGLAAVVLRRLGVLLVRRVTRKDTEKAEVRALLRDVIRSAPRTPPLLTTAPAGPLSLVVEARLLAGCPSLAVYETEQEVLHNPGDPKALTALAKALLYSQREDEARAALRWAQRMGADEPEVDYLRARLHRADHGALELCLRACRREPGYAEALYLCARLCLRLGYRSEGERLLVQIAPLMHLSVERLAYYEDLARLERRRRRSGPIAAEVVPPQ
jgi:hypothetical protein